jgi:hypothetical protein
MTPSIKVIRGQQLANGTYPYRVEGFAVDGVSRQPLLDACRQLKRLGADPSRQVCLFREGRDDWDLRASVGDGAGLTVTEDARGVRFSKFREFDAERFKSTAGKAA